MPPPLLLLLIISIGAITCYLLQTPIELLFLINSIPGLTTIFCAFIYALCTATLIYRTPNQLWTLLLWYYQHGMWASRSLIHQIIPDRRLVANLGTSTPSIAKPSIAYARSNKYTEDRDTLYTTKPSLVHCAGFTGERQCGHCRNKPTGMGGQDLVLSSTPQASREAIECTRWVDILRITSPVSILVWYLTGWCFWYALFNGAAVLRHRFGGTRG